MIFFLTTNVDEIRDVGFLTKNLDGIRNVRISIHSTALDLEKPWIFHSRFSYQFSLKKEKKSEFPSE